MHQEQVSCKALIYGDFIFLQEDYKYYPNLSSKVLVTPSRIFYTPNGPYCGMPKQIMIKEMMKAIQKEFDRKTLSTLELNYEMYQAKDSFLFYDHDLLQERKWPYIREDDNWLMMPSLEEMKKYNSPIYFFAKSFTYTVNHVMVGQQRFSHKEYERHRPNSWPSISKDYCIEDDDENKSFSIKTPHDAMSYSSDYPQMITNSSVRFSMYEKHRHNYFSRIMLESWQLGFKDEEPIKHTFRHLANGPVEWVNLTPDYIVQVKDSMLLPQKFKQGLDQHDYIIIDFAVTNNFDLAVSEKNSKYLPLCTYLSNQPFPDGLKRNFRFIPIIFSLEGDEYQWFNSMQPNMAVKAKDHFKNILKTEQRLKATPGYQAALRNKIGTKSCDKWDLNQINMLFNPKVHDWVSKLHMEALSKKEYKRQPDYFEYMMHQMKQAEKLRCYDITKESLLGNQKHQTLQLTQKALDDMHFFSNSELVEKPKCFKFTMAPFTTWSMQPQQNIMFLDKFPDKIQHREKLTDQMFAIYTMGREFCILDNSPHKDTFPIFSNTCFVQWADFHNWLSMECEYPCSDSQDKDLERVFGHSLNQKLSDFEVLECYKKSNAHNLATWFQSLALEIALNCNYTAKMLKKKEVAVKEYNWGHIVFRGGSMLTKGKSIRFKLCFKKAKQHEMHPFSLFFKSLDEYGCSKWLTMSYADLNHFIRFGDMMMMQFYYMYQKMLTKNTDCLWQRFKMIFCCCLEHRRETSVQHSYSRYMVHSALSYVSDKRACIKKLTKEPCRSFIHYMVRKHQLEWFKTNYNLATEDFLQMQLISQDKKVSSIYMINSIYCNFKIEMAEMMDEMHWGFYLEASIGSRAHKEKSILKKMIGDEINFQMNKLHDNFKVKNQDFFRPESELENSYDPDMLYLAGQNLKESIGDLNYEGLYNMLSETLDMVSSLKSSVVVSMVQLRTRLQKNSQEARDNLYCAIRGYYQDKGLHPLECSNYEDEMDFYFGTFAKDQIGSDREILIQDVISRMHIRVMETISKFFCKMLDQEMCSKGEKKFLIQANMWDDLTMKMQYDLQHQIDEENLTKISHNMDHSHWNNTQHTSMFIHFFKGLGLEGNILNFITNVMAAFSERKVAVPKHFQNMEHLKKLETTSTELFNDLKLLQTQDERVLLLEGGWGQGMLQFTSSLVHTATYRLKQKFSDFYLSRTTKKVIVKSNALISSDDATQFHLLYSKQPRDIAAFITYDYVLCNMFGLRSCQYMNYFKSGYNLLISEFNSSFMIGKRTLLACQKDIFNVCQMPDMSIPEDACKQLLSMEAMALKNGFSVSVCQLLRKLNRNFLCKHYHSEKLLLSLSDQLNCMPNQLPMALGVMPSNGEVENALTGSDYFIFKGWQEGSKTLQEFYEKVYLSYDTQDQLNLRNPLLASDILVSKKSMCLQGPTSKRMQKLKEKFAVDENLVMSFMEQRYWLYTEKPSTLNEMGFKLGNFTLNQSIRYEIDSDWQLHSLIRSKSIWATRATFYGFNTDMENIIRSNEPDKNNFELFIECVMMTEKYLSMQFHPSYEYYMKVVKYCKSFEAVSEWAVVRSTPIAFKFRRWSLSEFSDNYSINDRDLVKMFREKSLLYLRRYHMRLVDKICSYFKIDQEDQENLGKSLLQMVSEKFFKKEKRPIFSTINFLRKMVATGQERSVISIFPMPDQKNMEENLFSYFKSKFIDNKVLETDSTMDSQPNLDKKCLSILLQSIFCMKYVYSKMDSKTEFYTRLALMQCCILYKQESRKKSDDRSSRDSKNSWEIIYWFCLRQMEVELTDVILKEDNYDHFKEVLQLIQSELFFYRSSVNPNNYKSSFCLTSEFGDCFLMGETIAAYHSYKANVKFTSKRDLLGQGGYRIIYSSRKDSKKEAEKLVSNLLIAGLREMSFMRSGETMSTLQRDMAEGNESSNFRQSDCEMTITCDNWSMEKPWDCKFKLQASYKNREQNCLQDQESHYKHFPKHYNFNLHPNNLSRYLQPNTVLEVKNLVVEKLYSFYSGKPGLLDQLIDSTKSSKIYYFYMGEYSKVAMEDLCMMHSDYENISSNPHDWAISMESEDVNMMAHQSCNGCWSLVPSEILEKFKLHNVTNLLNMAPSLEQVFKTLDVTQQKLVNSQLTAEERLKQEMESSKSDKSKKGSEEDLQADSSSNYSEHSSDNYMADNIWDTVMGFGAGNNVANEFEQEMKLFETKILKEFESLGIYTDTEEGLQLLDEMYNRISGQDMDSDEKEGKLAFLKKLMDKAQKQFNNPDMHETKVAYDEMEAFMQMFENQQELYNIKFDSLQENSSFKEMKPLKARAELKSHFYSIMLDKLEQTDYKILMPTDPETVGVVSMVYTFHYCFYKYLMSKGHFSNMKFFSFVMQNFTLPFWCHYLSKHYININMNVRDFIFENPSIMVETSATIKDRKSMPSNLTNIFAVKFGTRN